MGKRIKPADEKIRQLIDDLVKYFNNHQMIYIFLFQIC